jgi:hypothetical protein
MNTPVVIVEGTVKSGTSKFCLCRPPSANEQPEGLNE